MESRESASGSQHLSTALPGGCLPPRTPAAEKAGTDTRSIAGVYVEASAQTTSLYQAVQEHFLQPDLALSLLEAQAATGGIVDWRRKQLVSVTEALRMGLVGLEMKERLLSAERARTGFVDPYTEEKISLYQAIQKELIGKQQGLGLLDAQIATGGIIEPSTGQRVSLQEACKHGYLGEETKDFLCDSGNEAAKGFWDPNSNQMVTYVELMRRCIADPASGLLLLPLKISFPGLRGGVCSHELLDSGIVDSALFKALHNGEITAQDVAEMDSVQQYLSGTGSVAGVAVLETNSCKSLYQALMEHLLPPGTAVTLLQAQAATGCLIDPVKNERFTADAAVRAGVVGPELHEKLFAAERAVMGYKDPCTRETISLFQAIKKGLVPRDPGIFLLDAQLATGGIVDPHMHHRLPVEVACQRGLLDRDTHALLCSPTDGICGFFEPNSKETLSYAELLLRCVTDPDTGLYLLPLSGDPSGVHSFIDHSTQLALKNTDVSVAYGKFKGKQASLWKLLFSDYFTGNQRRSLIQQLRSGGLSAQELAGIVCDTIQQVAANSKVTFKGLREKVTPAQLLSSKIINQDLFEKLTQGETLAKDVVGMDTVKKYLEGTGSIGGLILPDSEERISIYQAKRKGFLRPGTSLILLEAQAATGYLIDPAANKKYSVDEALRANLIGPEVYDKLLTAEKAVTGYTDPYTGNKISLFQAMMKHLIVKEHAIRLLEAQIATGGIIDPVNSHRLPVEAAYQRGYFDKKMNLILLDPSDDTKGFFDPNTHENLTYLQLKEKCITDSSTGLCLLPLNSKKRQFIDNPTKEAFRSSWLSVKYGRFQGQRVSIWDLLNSEYFSEGKRREVFNHYHLRMVSLDQIKLMLEEEMKKWAPIKFPAIRGHVTAYHLLESGILDRDLFERLLEGAVSPEEVLRLDSVRKYLYGTGSIGGIVLQPSNEKVGLYEAMRRNIVLPGVALPLLEAQAATGFLVDPVNSQKVCLEDAVKGGLIGPELYDKLQRAEEAVTGYKDPFTGQRISLFQAMKKGLVPDQQAMRLLDAQLSTGGVIDPLRGHYIPVEFAQKKGYLDENLSNLLSHSGHDVKTFSTLDSKENVTYGQLIGRCQEDEGTGFRLLPLSQTASLVCTDEQIERLFRETLVEEKGLTLWELLNSGYFTEEERREFLEGFRSEAISLQQLVSLVLGFIKEMEMKAQTQVTFQGLRGAVPAVWLLDNGILSEKTFTELVQGRKTAEEVAEMESVKRYLQSTGSIAGVFIQASKEKMGIYQAMQENLLLPGMGARLLEAQAATGSIVDLGSNRRLGVEEATKAGVVGKELTEQLLQAERALMGYKDPYSGRPISVCQAIRKELIPAAAGIPLLEAQLATGGVIDPIHHHHLPLRFAYKHGFYDEEMHKSLSQPTDDSCVFFDPNTQETLTYQQLKDRCIQDPETGLFLLPLSEDAAFYGDKQMMEVLKAETVSVGTGRFKGQVVSLWALLNSEYISNNKRRELLVIYKEENAEALQEIITVITKVIGETETQGKRFTFKGLRKQVSASDLFQAELIDKETLDELHQGKKTVQEVTEMDSVRKFLEGCNFIAGVLIQPSHEKMSIYQAMRRGLLRPGMALVILEAQAATGFLIDPVKNKKLSVDEGMASGLIGSEIYEKLLSAERAVTGYTHPYTDQQISLFEAMNEELIVRSHGIRLLEAQIATGGIIDPVHSHRIPVEVAYKRGYFDEKMNQILSDPTDDTKGFFDPNTHENLTYLQLLERCIQDPETGLYMLQIVRRGERYFYIDDTTKQFLQTQLIQMHVGRYKGQGVSIWDLLCSPYIQEQRRKDLVRQYKCETLTLERLVSIVTTIIEETEERTQKLRVKGLRGEVSAAELFNSEIIDKKTLDGLQQGAHALDQLVQKDSVKRYLEGTGCIAGVSVASKKKMTIYEAVKTGLLSPENGLMLLEAQAATGSITDPLKKKAFSVDQAVSARIVGDEIHEKLIVAEKAVTGYTDPATGKKLSLFQAMKKNIVERDHALRLLEAQLATGGTIDPDYGHRIPVEVAYKRGCLDEDTFLLLSDPEYGIKGFVDPNTHERITYAQLLQRCIKDKNTGMYLLQLLDKSEYFYVDHTTKNILASTKVNIKLGKYAGQTLSVWELLYSDYFDEEKRKELIKKYKQGSSAILHHIMNEILNIIEEKERNRRDIWFQGLRQQVTASELFKADIISQDTIEKLEEGRQTVQEVANMDSVRRYLEGSSCVAGVLVPSKSDPSKTRKMTIYEAMWRGILRPGTALVLLEAQAATGFIVDPLKNEKLSVDDAISTGLVGTEIHSKLLAAEKAVTGYSDPYTGKRISLFQAMKKDLIIKEHGIRLLEAQIATGGIIDPVNSHRIPVEVAYKRGYFDEQMNQVLSDPTDDTKGFFDPNTHENLTYMQLLKRCASDPDTGLLMLPIKDKGFGAFHSEENIRKTLKSTTIRVSLGQFQDQDISLWDLLLSTYISQYKRQQLLEEYKAEKITLEEITTLLKSIIEETEPWKNSLQTSMMIIQLKGLPDQYLSVWDALFSKYVPQDEREELVSSYRNGRLTLEKLTETLASLVAETTTTPTSDPRAPDSPSPPAASFVEQEEEEEAPEEGETEKALKARMVEISVGDFRGQKVSVWDLLHSKYIPEEKRKELLHLYKTGILNIDQMETVVTGIVNRTEEEKMKEAASHSDTPSSWEDPLRNHTVVLHVGEFQGQEASLWDLLFSQYISDSLRGELLTKYRSGILSIQEMIATLAPILAGREGSHIHAERGLASETTLSRADGTPPAMQGEELEQALRIMMVNVPVGELQGRERSAWELLFSKYVTADKRQELLEMYRSGAISAEELIRMLIILIEETEEKSNTLKFPGLRRQVSASELFSSQIIDQDTLADFTRGAKTVEEITEMDSVKRYLEGSSCIAGVLVPSKTDPSKMQKMTIYEAMWKGILRPGTALVLLEAQAATGFIVDPLKNEKLSVDDAVSAGLVGTELQEKLLSAERAVTGYNDPYTGNKISLFQAMNKGLIVKDHGIRLLEAQIATGGIIDPVHSHRLPVEAAYKRGLFDEELNQILSDPTDDTKGFFDPNTNENLTYMQLRLRCLPDPDTGLLMLHLMEKGSLFYALSDNTRTSLQSAKTRVDVGIFQGQEVSAWDLLFSRYIPPHKRQELLRQYKAGSITLQGIIQILTTIVTETEEGNTRHSESHKQPPRPAKRESLKHDATHPSLEETWEKTLKTTVINMPAGEHQGQQVFVWDLLFSSYITEEKRTELLELYRRGLLPMDRLISVLTTLVMKKEATNRKLDIKVRSPAQEMAAYEEARGASPSQPENWETSLRSHHLRGAPGELQDQQLSLWDALFSQYIPEDEREELVSNYRNGRLTLEKLTETLAPLVAETTTRPTSDPRAPDSPSTPTASFAEQKEEEEEEAPEQGETEKALKARMVEISVGDFRGQKVSVWDLLHSKYIPEKKRKELLHLYKTGILTIDQMETVITGIVNRTEEEKMKEATSHLDSPSSWEDHLRNHTQEEEAPEEGETEKALKARMVEISVGDFRGQKVSVWDLLHSKYIPEEKRKELLHLYKTGILNIDQMETVVTGIVNRTEEEKMKEAASHSDTPSSWEDPLRNHTVVLHVGEFQGQEASLWDLLFSQYISDSLRGELLTKYRSGILSIQEMIATLAPILAGREGSHIHAERGLASETTLSRADGTPPAMQGEELEQALRIMMVNVPVGELQGRERSAWELLFSKYVTADKRQELLEMYRSGDISAEELIWMLIILIEETEEKSNTLKFPGLRRQVSASELFSSQIIDQDTLSDFTRGAKTVEEITEMDSVKRYLEGSSCIAGVLVPSKTDPSKMQKMTIYEAMWKGILRPGTALVLLEAQAATGFIVDPLKNEKLSVDDAVSAGLVGTELQEKLLSAERAVTGYNDPYTGNKISLFQAMNKGLIVKDHGIRLLEAQIATGGIIDPVHSHRLPVEAAYKRGLFDEELNQILSDPTDDTKGFFDPNTNENLTYMQLRLRCLPDPDTGLLMLHLMEKGSLFYALSDNTRTSLQSAKARVDVGIFQGQEVSAWDLLFSRYIPPQKRQELLRQYKAGSITLQGIIQILTTIVTETEEGNTRHSESHKQPPRPAKRESLKHDATHPSLKETWEKTLKTTVINMPAGEHQGQQVFVWDLLFSSYITEEKRTELLELYRRGLLPMDRLISVLTTLVMKKEATNRKLDIKVRSPAQEMAAYEEARGASPSQPENWETSLRSHHLRGAPGELQDQQLSLWDALFSQYVPEDEREELVSNYRNGRLTLEKLTETLASLIAETTTRLTSDPRAPDSPSTPTASFAEQEEEEAPEQGETEKALKARMVEISVGDFRGQKVSVWDLLHSKYFPEEKRKELLHLYKTGILTIDQMETVVTGIVNRTEEEKMKEPAPVVPCGSVVSGEGDSSQSSYYDLLQHTLRLENIDVTVREIQGQKSSVWDPFFSQFVSNIRTEEVVHRHGAPAVSVKESIRSITTVITKTESTPYAMGESPKGDTMSPDRLMPSPSKCQVETENALKSRMVKGSFGDVFGPHVSLWDACHCEHIPEDKRKDLLDLFKTGMLNIDQLETIVTTILNKIAEEKMKEGSHPVLHSELWEDLLRNHTVVLHVGEFQGRETSLWDLLFSQYIPENKREELLINYRNGRLSLEELTEILASLFAESTTRVSGHLRAPDTPSPTTASFEEEEEETAADTPEQGETEKALKARMVEISVGDFRGQKVSVWDLLHSKYIPEKKRKELLHLYKTGILNIDQMETVVTGIVNRTEEEKMKEATSHLDSPSSWEDPLRNHTVVLHVGEFQGQETSLWDLLFSHYTPEYKREELLINYRNGRLSLEELTEILASFIAETTTRVSGHPTVPEIPRPTRASFAEQEEEAPEEGETEKALKARMVEISVGDFHGQKVSVWDLLHSKYIPEEKRKELLHLYKTGILNIDQMETVVTGIINRTEEEKMKEAASHSDTPSSWEDPLRNHTVVLHIGEFQGQETSLWDLLFSHYTPECKREELLINYRNGRLSLEELTEILASFIAETPTRVSGHPRVPEMPRPTTASFAEQQEEEEAPEEGETENALKARMVEISVGDFHGQKVSVWDLLHSKYIPEEKRKELLQLYKTGILTIDQMETVIAGIVNRTEEENTDKARRFSNQDQETNPFTKSQNASFGCSLSLENMLRSESSVVPFGDFQGQMVSCWDLLFSRYISEDKRQELLNKFKENILSVQELIGTLTNIITEAERQDQSSRLGSSQLGISEKSDDSYALQQQQLKKSLRTTMVPVICGQFKGQKVCVLDLLFSKYVPQDKRQELLELYRAGTLPIQDMVTMIIAMIEEAEHKHEKVDAAQNIPSGLLLLRLLQKEPEPGTPASLSVQRAPWALPGEGLFVFTGHLPGHSVQRSSSQGWIPHNWQPPVWHGHGPVTVPHDPLQQAMEGVLGRDSGGAPAGPTPRRRPDPSAPQPMSETKQAATGATEEMPIVQVREEPQWPFPCPPEQGEEPLIAGVLKEPSKEKLTIQKAMRKGLLTRGTGLALLEAQAVSGYIVDPIKNRKLSVRDSTNAGLIDREYFNTLLVAEKAVTGYTDPFSGNKISLFQAMKKGLLVKDHGIRLLEAQVATGGLTHPMHSHRLPVELAHKWGYLDREICDLIADPANHSKRCFDPVARENLTYTQLLHRCVPDPETGLLMVQVMEKGSIVSKLDKGAQKSLQAATTRVNVGLFQGQDVSVWDLLFSRYIPLPKKQELLKQYKAGSVTLQDMIGILHSIIAETETKGDSFRGQAERPSQEMELKSVSEQEELEKTLKSRMVKVSAGEYRGRKVSVWDLLHSKYIPEEKQKELLKLCRSGILSTDQMEMVVTAMVTKIEEVRAKELGHATGTGREMDTMDDSDFFDPEEEELRKTLQLTCIPVTLGEFKGQNVPLLDIISSKYFPQDKRQELLHLYRAGTFSTEQMSRAVSGILEKLEASRKKLIVKVIGRRPGAPGSKEGLVAADSPPSKHLDDLLKSKKVTMPTGELQGQQVSVWELLFSHYIARDKREELLRKYRDGTFGAGELSSILIILASLHDLFDSLECATPKTSKKDSAQGEAGPAAATFEEEEDDDDDEDNDGDEDHVGDIEDQDKDKALKSRMVSVTVGEFRGRKVSLWDLLHSKYMPEKKRQEILRLYRIGILSVDQMETVITAIVAKVAEKMSVAGRHMSASSPDVRTGGSRRTRGKPRRKTVEILTIDFPLGEFQGRSVSMWDLLFSRYVPEAKRQELLARYITGTLSSQEVLAILTSLIMETHKLRCTPSLYHPLTTWLPEALGLSQDQRASLRDLHCPPLQEEPRAGTVTVSEITVTTTVINGPEQKQGERKEGMVKHAEEAEAIWPPLQERPASTMDPSAATKEQSRKNPRLCGLMRPGLVPAHSG
uniref:epiplakin-like n=1 Tax=Euleptes europaea TaxID=460621 RepID=UPI0025412A9C|nr:epiplakin-like [Euleptes europaea]